MGLIIRTKNATIILSCFHHHRKIRQLICTEVYVQPVEIVLQNRFGCITLRPTARGIDVHKHIERIDKNMTATHARVNNLDLLRLYLPIFRTHFFQFCLDGILLLCFFQIIFPVGIFRLAMSFCPKPSQRIFYHISNYPVRRKKLCCRRNAFRTDFNVLFQVGKNFVFRFGVVILVQPADNLHLVLPVFFGNIFHHVGNYAVITQ